MLHSLLIMLINALYIVNLENLVTVKLLDQVNRQFNLLHYGHSDLYTYV